MKLSLIYIEALSTLTTLLSLPKDLVEDLRFHRNQTYNLMFCTLSPNIIDTCITHQSKSFFVSYVYGAPRRDERADLWNKLSELGAQLNESWLITGDFNDLLNNSEKIGSPLRWEGSFLSFRSFVTQYGIWDL